MLSICVTGIQVILVLVTVVFRLRRAGQLHLTKVLAVRLGERNITVNAIAPGRFENQMTKWMLEQFRAQIEADCPLKRIGTPADVAGAAILPRFARRSIHKRRRDPSR